MTNPGTGSFPTAALDWLAPAEAGRVLAVGTAAAGTANRLAARGNSVVICDRSDSAVRACAQRFGSLRPITASAGALPFASGSFDRVLVAQRAQLILVESTLDEFARVLVPGGYLAVLQTVRDDSVPWVRRLAGILRKHDSTAMTGGQDLDGLDSIAESAHFPHLEHRAFRLWLPITRPGLADMVSSTPVFSTLDQTDADRLIAEVGRLYDASARAPEPLMLPYSVLCWRSEVNHSELSAALRLPEDGFRIRF